VSVRVVQFEVRPKVRVRELSRILTNLKSAVRSSVKVRRTLQHASVKIGQQPPQFRPTLFLQ